MNRHIFVVEDEPEIRELVEYHLRREGFRVTGFESGEEALERLRTDIPDLIVLDIMLPGLDGLEICKRLKVDKQASGIPVVVLTARGEESDIVSGLEVGADDYITKPFSPRVLVARVRARLRGQGENNSDEDEIIKLNRIYIDPRRHLVKVDGRQLRLTPTEFRVLTLLARNPGWVFSRYEIVNVVRGDDVIVTDRSVDVQMVGLRKKLGDCGQCIETVRGFGYRLRDSEPEA
jgi:two-component system phosphate regulon response regulator PhoB